MPVKSKTNHVSTLSLCCLALSTTLFVAPNAMAQGSEVSFVLEEIIVTARKREETLRDAPIAVTAFGRSEIQSAGFTDILEVQRATPGLFIEASNQAFARINTTPRFRGVFFSSGDRLSQTATVFMDGIYMSGGIQTIGVNELERIEIVKGPQSAQFGRNTFAGAINYITREPGEEFSADIDATIASKGEYRLAAGVEGSILGDVLLGRLSVNHDVRDGHYDNAAVAGQDLGDEEQTNISGVLVFQPTDNFRSKLRIAYREIDDGPSAAAATAGINMHNFGGFAGLGGGVVDTTDRVIPPGIFDLFSGAREESVFAGVVGAPPASAIGQNTGRDTLDLLRLGFNNELAMLNAGLSPGDPGFVAPTLLDYNIFNVNAFGLELDSTQISLHNTLDVSDNLTISLIAGYNEEAYGRWSDFDQTADDSLIAFGSAEVEDFSIEGRVSGVSFDDRLTWSVGASFVDIEITSLGGSAEFLDGPSAFGPATGTLAVPNWFGDIFGSAVKTGAETTGIFASLDYQLFDEIAVTLELRRQEDEIQTPAVNAGLPNPISPATIDSTLPRFTVRYQPAENTTLYATYSEGNLPGGFNSEVAELDAGQLAELLAESPGASVTFGEETLKNHELGWKQTFADGRAAFNMALFYMERTDEIFRSIVNVTDGMGGFQTVAFTDNGASTDITGIEIDGSWAVTDNLLLQTSFAYIDAEIASFPAESGTGDFDDIFGSAANVVGQEAPRFPPLTASWSAAYEKDLSNAFLGFDSWFARGDAYYRGKYYDSNSNVTEIQEALDANVRFGLRKDNVSIELFVTNLFEENAPSAGSNFADVSAAGRTILFDFRREGVQVGLRDKRQIGLRASMTF